MTEENIKAARGPDWAKVNQEYKDWRKEISYIPYVCYNILFLFILLVILFFIAGTDLLGQQANVWIITFSTILLIFLLRLARKEGHKDGYLDGYGDGYGQARDDALGIAHNSEAKGIGSGDVPLAGN